MVSRYLKCDFWVCEGSHVLYSERKTGIWDITANSVVDGLILLELRCEISGEESKAASLHYMEMPLASRMVDVNLGRVHIRRFPFEEALKGSTRRGRKLVVCIFWSVI